MSTKAITDKLIKANHRYAFISQVNKKIVRVKDEATLFQNACKMAVEFGKFKMAWVGKFTDANKTISLAEQSGFNENDISLLTYVYSSNKGLLEYVLSTGSYYICNDVTSDFELENWKPFALKHHIGSVMVLPITKAGAIVGTFNLYSSEINFFDKEEIAMLLDVAMDISAALDEIENAKQQREKEELFIKNETRLKEAQAIGNIANWEIDLVHNIHIWSDEFYRIYGMSIDEVQPSAELFLSFIHPDDAGFAHKKIKEAFETFEASSINFRFIRKDKCIGYGYIKWRFEFDKNNEPIRFYGILQDITDRKVIEKELTESESKYRGLFEKMADGVYKSSSDGKFIDVNPALVKMLGYDNEEELLKIDIKSQLYFETSDRDNAVLQDQTEGMTVFRLRKKDGSEIWVEDRGQYVLDENGIALYHEGILRDVTKRKEQQDALEKSNRELRKTNQELDRFVYSVSHDLRAPLLSMQGIVNITAEETKEEMTAEHMQMLNGSINRLDNFIDEILDYSRNARAEIKKDTINFKDMLQHITDDLKHMSSGNIPVTVDVDIHAEGTFCSDKGRLNVVLNNLISNAIRYHNPETETPFVKIRINSNNDHTQIEIEDNGIGISEANQLKVFEMFYRVSENSVGSGLGLYIVKETVDKLRGEIGIESQTGIGTKFKLNIPNLFFQ